MQAVSSEFFDGKCEAFIAGYRFVPRGETWTREDGTVFAGEMIAPWLPSDGLEKAQAEYEHKQLAAVTAEKNALLEDMQALIDEILGGDEDV